MQDTGYHGLPRIWDNSNIRNLNHEITHAENEHNFVISPLKCIISYLFEINHLGYVSLELNHTAEHVYFFIYQVQINIEEDEAPLLDAPLLLDAPQLDAANADADALQKQRMLRANGTIDYY